METRSSTASREVRWELEGDAIDATLVRPAGAGPFPGVIFVAGSGPTDRNWNTPLLPGTNGSAALLANAFAAVGVASLRYDKRASGPRAQATIAAMVGRVSMQSHVDELAGAVSALSDEPGIDRDRLFIVANSEGTLHALNYALQPSHRPIAGLVLIAPPGRSVGVVARAQIAAQLVSVPDGAAILERYDEAIAQFMAGEPITAASSLPPGMQGLLQALTAPANLPLARELWHSDGAPLLARIRIPTLVVIGQKDTQIDWRDDGSRLETAASGSSEVSFAFPPDANHVLKHEARPRDELGAEVALRYNAADARLDAVGLDIVTDWLLRHASR